MLGFGALSAAPLSTLIPTQKAYTADQATEFAAEVEGAASYLAALGWN